ncbi:MAG: hypothetical protein JWM19_7480 [Actinomycetia bacterium]|nr:hypothetical protein [Actinomycetes bacterium]
MCASIASVMALSAPRASCWYGQATAANQRISDALGIRDAEPDPGDEDDDTEQAS